MQHEHELAMHVKAALRNGLTPDQIQEVLLQVAVYAGVPVANRAFPVAQRALAEAAEAAEPMTNVVGLARRVLRIPVRLRSVGGPSSASWDVVRSPHMCVRHANACTHGDR